MKWKKYFFLAICLLGASLNFNLLLKPYHLVTGGTQGMAILIEYMTHLKPYLIVLIINIVAIIVSYFFLSSRETKSAILSTLAYPLFIKLTCNIPQLPWEMPLFIVAILAGLVCGLTGGFIYRLGFSSGGITVLNLLCQKYLHIKVSIVNFIVNGIIIALGIFYFGIAKALYSILVIGIGSLMIYFILKGKKEE